MMKKTLAVLMALACAFTMTSMAVYAEEVVYAGTDTTLVFKTASNTAGNIAAVAYVNTQLTVLDDSDENFYKISYTSADPVSKPGDAAIGAVTGFVRKTDVSATAVTVPADNTPAAEFDLEVLRLVNIERAKVGLPAYQNGSVKLWKAARIRVNELITSFDINTRPNGTGADTVFTEVGLTAANRYQAILPQSAEKSTPSAVVRSLMHLAYHRPGLLASDRNNLAVRHIGVSQGYTFWFVCALQETAQNLTAQRLYGNDRHATAVDISKKGWTSAQNVIITNSLSPYDALAGGPLAKKLDAPILLTAGDALTAEVTAEIERLGAKNIYILGGVNAVKQSIQDTLSAMEGVTVERIYGEDRYNTAIKIAEKLDALRGSAPSRAFIADGKNYPDALSISSVAALMNLPILFTASGQPGINPATLEYIKSKNIKNATLIGGTAVVSNDVAVRLTGAGATCNRVSGDDRYRTSAAIYNAYKSVFAAKGGAALASGGNFPDALAGSSFAAKKAIPMILIRPDGNRVAETRTAILAAAAKDIFVLGGPAALGDIGIENNAD
ncbi:MAG: cell wall-binding repeat-containing protein [Oscillospiraceae bacterium]|nr:cell wall-binding repeat-containing protein [Oscillospiraceae bacterium]